MEIYKFANFACGILLLATVTMAKNIYLKNQLSKIRFAICVPKLNMVCVSICTCDCKPFMNMHADNTLYGMARLVLLVK